MQHAHAAGQRIRRALRVQLLDASEFAGDPLYRVVEGRIALRKVQIAAQTDTVDLLSEQGAARVFG